MAEKTASVVLSGGSMRFEGLTGSGHTIVIDSTDGDTGARPNELVILGLAACTGMDVISILRKKRQEVDRYEVQTRADMMEEHPHAYTRIDVLHVVEGQEIDVEAVHRAIELSATKYCSVGSTLSSGVTELHHYYRILDGAGRDETAEVLVTGPLEALDALGTRNGSPASV